MSGHSVVRVRVDDGIREEATAVLETMGLTVSEATRMMLTRVAREKALLSQPLAPNGETLAAMRESRAGTLPRFANADALMTDLNASD